MRLEIANDPDELPDVMRALAEFGASESLPARVLQAAELALDELLTNVICYAYPAGQPHRIGIRLEVDAAGLHIEIEDDGLPFDPFSADPPELPRSVEESEPGGLGIHLVREFMDRCEYRREGERNIVSLHKRI